MAETKYNLGVDMKYSKKLEFIIRADKRCPIIRSYLLNRYGQRSLVDRLNSGITDSM